jgi:hypothetical protein
LYFVKVEYKTCIQVAPPACCLFCRKKRQETRRHGCCNEQKRGKTKSPQERCQERNQKRNQTQRLCVCVCVCVCVWGGGGILGNKGDKHLLWRYEENFLGFQSAYKHLDKDEIPWRQGEQKRFRASLGTITSCSQHYFRGERNRNHIDK